jgi:hypothetical protein
MRHLNPSLSFLLCAGLLAACNGSDGSTASEGVANAEEPNSMQPGLTPGDEELSATQTNGSRDPSAPVHTSDDDVSSPGEASEEPPRDAASDAPQVIVSPDDPDLDSDADGLTDVEEIEVYGTSPAVADTDGDGFSDFDEVITKSFDPETSITQFNPRVADVPMLAIELVSAPAIAVTYTESSGTARSVGTERSQSSSTANTHSWGGSNSRSIEMTHTAGVELGIEHEFGPTGGTTLSATLSYEFSHSTTNEQTVTWSDEQSEENSRALAEIENLEATEGTELDGGYLQMAARLRNTGHIAFAVEGVTLAAFTRDPLDPANIGPMGTLTYLDAGNPTVFPRTAIRPGEALPPATFNLNFDLGTAKDLLADSSALVIAPVTGSLSGVNGEDFGLAATNIHSRTAEVVIDYGTSRPQESYRIAVATNQDRPLVTVERVFSEYLRIPFEVGAGSFRYGSESQSRSTFSGLKSVRGTQLNESTSSYWIVSHTHSVDNGLRSVTDTHNLVLGAYDFAGLQLSKGDVLHMVYVQDSDRDGLGERTELLYGTDPNKPDTDDDGLSDFLEVGGWSIAFEGEPELAVTSDPLRVDTDADGDDDQTEYDMQTHPRISGLKNTAPELHEVVLNTNGFVVTFTGQLLDADDNVSALSVDWGDGSEPQVLTEPALGAFSLQHEYQSEGEFSISLSALDELGAESPAVTHLVRTTLPSDGLALHMDFDGTLEALTGTALQNAHAAPTFSTDRHRLGERALNLHGTGSSDEYSLLVGDHLDLSLNFSIALWVNLTQGSFNGNLARIAGQGDWFNLYSSSTNSGVSFGILEGQSPKDGEVQISDNIALDSGWHLYVAVVEQVAEGSELRLYRDGVQTASKVVKEVYVNPGACKFYVGNWARSSACDDIEAAEFDGFPGSIDDLRVYQRALSGDEVLLLHGER